MTYAVVQGCSKGLCSFANLPHSQRLNGSITGLGRAVSRLLLEKTNLNVIGTTASGADHAKESILSGQNSDAHDRLTTLDMDVCNEGAIKHAAASVKDKFGQQLRLLVNVSGVVRSECALLRGMLMSNDLPFSS